MKKSEEEEYTRRRAEQEQSKREHRERYAHRNDHEHLWNGPRTLVRFGDDGIECRTCSACGLSSKCAAVDQDGYFSPSRWREIELA